MKIAVIDLGTNTCNLLIAEVGNANYKILHQSKLLIGLGDGHIGNHKISPEATLRALNSLRAHKITISDFGVDKVKVLATSAVRSAQNKIEFLEKMSSNSGWVIKVVSGEKEADLIFKGAMLALKNFDKPSVILDIGGGSNEVILTCGSQMLWKESRVTGMARIIHRFSFSDPIRSDEIKTLEDFFLQEYRSAFKKITNEQAKTLIGCSGAFDTIADMIDAVVPGSIQRLCCPILLRDFWNVYDKLLKSTRKKRLEMKGMDLVRVDLIVPAMVLIGLFIRETGISQIIQTDFAIREGVLYEELEQHTDRM